MHAVLDEDLVQLRKTDEEDRVDLWNQIEHSKRTFDEEFARRLPRDIASHSRSQFAFARLLLAAAAHLNKEESAITDRFSQEELDLVKDFEKFNVFDVLSTDELVDRIHRKGDIYNLVMEFYKGQWSDLDLLLDDPEIEKDLKYAFKTYYGKRLGKVKKAVLAYADKYGLITAVSQIEQKVWDTIKQSEAERITISESLRKQIAAAASKLKPLDQVERESQSFGDELCDVQRRVLTGTGQVSIGPLQSEKDRLTHSYLGFEREIADLIEATEKKQRELAAREAELERARQEYEHKMQEENQRVVENELKEIEALKGNLASEARSLGEEKASLRLRRQEMDDRLRQITEALEGKSVRFVTKEDAKLCELNFIARFDTKMQSFPVRIHSPLEGKTYETWSWNETSHVRFAEGHAPDAPANARSRYIVSEKKYGFFGERMNRVIIEAVSLNHLKEFQEYAFDARRANLSEFLSLIARFIDSAEIGKYLHVIGIASPTGWDERVGKEIGSSDFARNYVSRYVSICLVDSVTGAVSYNLGDDRIAKFIELFRPQFDRERVEKVKGIIVRKLSERDHVVFEDVLEETKEERAFVNKALHDLAREKKGRLRYVKEVGLVLEVER